MGRGGEGATTHSPEPVNMHPSSKSTRAAHLAGQGHPKRSSTTACTPAARILHLHSVERMAWLRGGARALRAPCPALTGPIGVPGRQTPPKGPRGGGARTQCWEWSGAAGQPSHGRHKTNTRLRGSELRSATIPVNQPQPLSPSPCTTGQERRGHDLVGPVRFTAGHSGCVHHGTFGRTQNTYALGCAEEQSSTRANG